jgi:hypothetical protein
MKQAIVFMLLMALVAPAAAIQVGISSNAGSSYTSIDSSIDDPISINTAISGDQLQNRISGKGSFRDSHGAPKGSKNVKVDVDIVDAKSYDYSYILDPNGSTITASESLNASNALSIKASAKASYGSHVAQSNISIDHGSLKGYLNKASVSDSNELITVQEFSKADGDKVKVSAWGRYNRDGDAESQSVSSFTTTTADYSSLANYSDQAKVIVPKGKVFVTQSGHIDIDPMLGKFQGEAYTKTPYLYYNDDPKVIRTSNYGTRYDFKLESIIDSHPGSIKPITKHAEGCLGYYININSPQTNRIQSAIDVASKGDSINVGPGIYYENLIVKKALTIIGSGADKTVIDGQRKGSVIDYRKNDDALVLKKLALTNGKAEHGGGIKAVGDLQISDCIIHNNHADFGGGVYHKKKLTMSDSSVLYNSAKYGGGGVFTNGGKFEPEDTKIISNDAAYGGGSYVFNGKVDLGENVTFIDNVARRKGQNMFNEASDNTNLEGDLSKIGYGLHTQERETILNWKNIWTVLSETATLLGGIYGAYSAWIVLAASTWGWFPVAGFIFSLVTAVVALIALFYSIYNISCIDRDMCPEPE